MDVKQRSSINIFPLIQGIVDSVFLMVVVVWCVCGLYLSGPRLSMIVRFSSTYSELGGHEVKEINNTRMILRSTILTMTFIRNGVSRVSDRLFCPISF